MYTKAKESTLGLVPLLSRFRLADTYAPPNLPEWIGSTPANVDAEDEEDLVPIGGVDEEDGKSLEEEMTILSEAKRQDLVVRFKKTADGVYVEAKRSAIGGVAQVPLYFYGLLLALGWNEIVAGKSTDCYDLRGDSPVPSASKPPVFHLSHSSWCGCLRHLYTESMGSYAENGQRGVCTSGRGGQRKTQGVLGDC